MIAGWKNNPAWVMIDKMLKEERALRRYHRQQYEAQQEALRQQQLLRMTVTADTEKPQ